MSSLSLKTRLALGAALLGLGTLLTSAILWLAMENVSARLNKAVASEARMDKYAALSKQAASYLVVATETLQSNLSAEDRMERLVPIEDQLSRSFERLQADVVRAVQDAEKIGLDEQSRFGAQSLHIARMQALVKNASRGLARDVDDARMLRPNLDAFSGGFDLLLSQAVNNELLFRDAILRGIETLRQRLRITALFMAGLTIIALTLYYLFLIRPQFARLDRLRAAAQQIGGEDFKVALPQDETDEIGRLYGETNRMAAALAARQQTVQQEWDRLNETISERTLALKEANATLAEIDENRRRFFADISHELRTPLTVILMEAHIGAQQSSEDVKVAFETIESRAQRLTRKIDDLLRVARSESGQLKLELSAVFLPELIEAVVAEVSAEITSAGMILQSPPPPDASIAADPNWIRQVLVSIVRNAIRHARSGKRVSIACEIDEGWIEISITDNGPGVPYHIRDTMFDRFSQGGGGTASQGFGIGLALARWVVEEHGGDISIESPIARDFASGDNPGTKMVVRIPVAGG